MLGIKGSVTKPIKADLEAVAGFIVEFLPSLVLAESPGSPQFLGNAGPRSSRRSMHSVRCAPFNA
jgi:hypothetical protein